MGTLLRRILHLPDKLDVSHWDIRH